MPVAWCYEVADEEKKYCSTGFPIGCHVSDDGQQRDACVTSVSFLYCFLDIAWNMCTTTVFGFSSQVKRSPLQWLPNKPCLCSSSLEKLCEKYLK